MTAAHPHWTSRRLRPGWRRFPLRYRRQVVAAYEVPDGGGVVPAQPPWIPIDGKIYTWMIVSPHARISEIPTTVAPL